MLSLLTLCLGRYLLLPIDFPLKILFGNIAVVWFLKLGGQSFAFLLILLLCKAYSDYADEVEFFMSCQTLSAH